MVGLNTIKSSKTTKPKQRVGRGGKRGKTSGRGTKGQKARAGHSIRPQVRDLIKKLPKLRGHGKNRAKSVVPKEKFVPVNLDQLEKVFKDGDVVNRETLLEKGLIEKKSGKLQKAKILARGEISKKLTIEGIAISSSAKKKIEKAGGSVK